MKTGIFSDEAMPVCGNKRYILIRTKDLGIQAEEGLDLSRSLNRSNPEIR